MVFPDKGPELVKHYIQFIEQISENVIRKKSKSDKSSGG
jgi:hypothetical protein